jgi:hypothetical protein
MAGRCTRKHTPIVSQKQRGLFGVWKAHPSRRPASITEKEVSGHLKESKGKKLPVRSKRAKRR